MLTSSRNLANNTDANDGINRTTNKKISQNVFQAKSKTVKALLIEHSHSTDKPDRIELSKTAEKRKRAESGTEKT